MDWARTITICDLCIRRFCAMALAVYPVCAMAAVTLLRVLSATFSGFLIARLTVAIETPASFATSSIVAGLIGCFSNFSYAFH
jgi:hypothetical protein